MGKVGFEPTKPEGSGFTVRPNSPSLALTHNHQDTIYSFYVENFKLAVCIFSGTEGIRTLNLKRDKLAF